MEPTSQRYITLGFTVIFVFVLFIAFTIIRIVIEERTKVQKMPRQEMVICDTHGPYPKTASLWIDVPQDGKADLRQEICPFCFNERLDKTKKELFK